MRLRSPLCLPARASFISHFGRFARSYLYLVAWLGMGQIKSAEPQRTEAEAAVEWKARGRGSCDLSRPPPFFLLTTPTSSASQSSTEHAPLLSVYNGSAGSAQYVYDERGSLRAAALVLSQSASRGKGQGKEERRSGLGERDRVLVLLESRRYESGKGNQGLRRQ